jgi:hypothetical protein
MRRDDAAGSVVGGVVGVAAIGALCCGGLPLIAGLTASLLLFGIGGVAVAVIGGVAAVALLRRRRSCRSASASADTAMATGLAPSIGTTTTREPRP